MQTINKISIIIPVYNEKNTIKEIIDRVNKASTLGLKKEIIVVDDGSTDGTSEILKKIKKGNIKIYFLKKNRGKGFALRHAFPLATGEIILIQDADLEYHPREYTNIIKQFINNKAVVVYGSRELSGKNKHSSSLFHIGGRLVTTFVNLLYNSNLTDAPTGYKAFRREILTSIPLKCERFEFCPEVTAHLLKRGINIIEIPIGYSARHINEGKKIKVKDGAEALWTLFKVKINL